jgi:hypothetical protein
LTKEEEKLLYEIINKGKHSAQKGKRHKAAKCHKQDKANLPEYCR